MVMSAVSYECQYSGSCTLPFRSRKKTADAIVGRGWWEWPRQAKDEGFSDQIDVVKEVIAHELSRSTTKIWPAAS